MLEDGMLLGCGTNWPRSSVSTCCGLKDAVLLPWDGPGFVLDGSDASRDAVVKQETCGDPCAGRAFEELLSGCRGRETISTKASPADSCSSELLASTWSWTSFTCEAAPYAVGMPLPSAHEPLAACSVPNDVGKNWEG